MNEMNLGDAGVLRTRGMKVVHGARVAESTGLFEQAGRVSEARERKVPVGRGAGAQPGGLAGWVLGLMARREGLKEARHLRVLETQALGGRRQLMLVVCDGERFLVGGGPDRVDTIVRIGAAVNPAEEPCV